MAAAAAAAAAAATPAAQEQQGVIGGVQVCREKRNRIWIAGSKCCLKKKIVEFKLTTPHCTSLKL